MKLIKYTAALSNSKLTNQRVVYKNINLSQKLTRTNMFFKKTDINDQIQYFVLMQLR